MLYLQKPDFPDWILTKKGTRTSESEEQILKRSSQHSKRSPAPTWMYSIILVLVTMGLCCVRYGVKDWTTDDRIKQRIYMSLCVWAYVCVCVCLSYADGLWGEVALGDHEVAGFVQLDDGSSVGLYLSLKRLVFLELALLTHTHTHQHQSETLEGCKIRQRKTLQPTTLRYESHHWLAAPFIAVCTK